MEDTACNQSVISCSDLNRTHVLSHVKPGVFINLIELFYYRKEDLIPGGCELRSFRMVTETKAFLQKSTEIPIKTSRDQALFLNLKHQCLDREHGLHISNSFVVITVKFQISDF